MADVRIKDIPGTATSASPDDYLPIDGATNGTRKILVSNIGGTPAGALLAANNLSDVASASSSRTNLGLGTLATQNGTFSGTSSGTNTGDQTTVSGNAGTATKLATARKINNTSFDGSADIVLTKVVSVAFASTVTPNCDTTDILIIGALTGNITLGAPSGTPTDGQRLMFRMAQDGTGSRTTTWNSAYVYTDDITTALIPSTASKKWNQLFIYDLASTKWVASAINRGTP